ncbi:MarR family transcriptional regulator [Allokutzneria sp. A3M-2-11 16]|uniref:MarR family winged helix-turn-helix transcriptional regulator n=1 Tax=Allokutzneria sp. A3M-2-11 16 TaxID=2962043 RepID=UPI0020B6C2F8|nr:winged helix DNA-binding protein [Allokutzneria sp. A3M-2-11 16]MCP3804060.1 MarR family transcriptional regulator [Allokutzneria sp. A3M-2-11 16]
MKGLELFLLGRRLMKIGERAFEPSHYHRMPASVRTVMLDVFENPDSSVSEITARTGFPQSHVSASVARLREDGVLVTTADPKDRRRTLVRQAPDVPKRAAKVANSTVDDALAAALGTDDPEEVRETVELLEKLAVRLWGTMPPLPPDSPP